jgi:hypothetical protein
MLDMSPLKQMKLDLLNKAVSWFGHCYMRVCTTINVVSKTKTELEKNQVRNTLVCMLGIEQGSDRF